MSSADIIQAIQSLGEEFADAIKTLSTEQEIRAAQARFVGKKGRVTALMKEMGKLDPDQRKVVGEAFNRVKNAITDAVAEKLADLENQVLAANLARSVDLSLPGRRREIGHRHVLSQVRAESVAIFSELGYDVREGPQIETDFHCFEALAMHKEHPARDMQDTFYVTDDIVLRPHTSPVQIRTMETQAPPVKIVAPGVVYRRDDDPTHSPMFTQIEGLLVDKHVRFSDLKGVLAHYVTRFFGKSLEIRFRPSYFPFVEPGAEVDMQCSFCMGGPEKATCRVCKGSGRVEIGGAGMVDPDVFAAVGYDSEEYTGFAFGMGLERMAMLRHNINDIKYYYEGDLRFLRQF